MHQIRDQDEDSLYRGQMKKTEVDYFAVNSEEREGLMNTLYTATTRPPSGAPRRRLGHAVAVALALGLTGCSSEAMYNAIQENRLQACEALPIAQQEGCKAQYQSDYESYRRDRDS